MSLYGLVHPEQEKYQSLNWSWVRAQQLAPQGLGPYMDTRPQFEYGEYAPYISPSVINNLQQTQPFRIWGYPNVSPCGKMAPLLYAPRRDPNPQQNTKQCSCNAPIQRWPYGFYCGQNGKGTCRVGPNCQK
jgi:hypothetical protein